MRVFRVERMKERPRQPLEQADHAGSSGISAAAVDRVGKRPRPAHRRKRQRRVEVGEKLAAARTLPNERQAQCLGIDRDQDQIGFLGKMLRRGLGELGGGGKMDEAVALIGLRSEKLPIGLGRPPQRLLADFVDRRHRFPATGRDPIGAKPLVQGDQICGCHAIALSVSDRRLRLWVLQLERQRRLPPESADTGQYDGLTV